MMVKEEAFHGLKVERTGRKQVRGPKPQAVLGTKLGDRRQGVESVSGPRCVTAGFHIGFIDSVGVQQTADDLTTAGVYQEA
jgi:hypothetical protein